MNTPCPSWCRTHVGLDDGQPAHLTAVVVRDVVVRVEQADDQTAPTLVLPDMHRMSPRDAHRLAAALVGALAQLEDDETA